MLHSRVYMGPSRLVRRMRTSVPCAGMVGNSSAVMAVPGLSTWPACPLHCGRSPGELHAPHLLTTSAEATPTHAQPPDDPELKASRGSGRSDGEIGPFCEWPWFRAGLWGRAGFSHHVVCLPPSHTASSDQQGP
jgi:hypothetical protein